MVNGKTVRDAWHLSFDSGWSDILLNILDILKKKNGFPHTEEGLYTQNVCFLKTFDTFWYTFFREYHFISYLLVTCLYGLSYDDVDSVLLWPVASEQYPSTLQNNCVLPENIHPLLQIEGTFVSDPIPWILVIPLPPGISHKHNLQSPCLFSLITLPRVIFVLVVLPTSMATMKQIIKGNLHGTLPCNRIQILHTDLHTFP